MGFDQYHEPPDELSKFLLRHKKKWQIACRGVLFHDGDIVELGEKAEEEESEAG
jgi:hypothetical protein